MNKKNNDFLIYNYIKNNDNALTFYSLQANSTIQINFHGTSANKSFYYRLNDNTWNKYTIGDIITLSNSYQKISFKSISQDLNNAYQYYTFEMTGSFSATGQINSLINYSNLYNLCFYYLFSGCTSLIEISNTLLPSQKLAYGCYDKLFHNTGISKIPKGLLHSTSLSYQSYKEMFANCKNLKQVIIETNIFTYDKVYDDYEYIFCNKWLQNVSSSGDFYGPASLSGIERGPSTIPSGWVFHPID